MGYVDTPTRTFAAGAARVQYLRVYLNSGVLTTAGATEQSLGVQRDESFAATDPVAVLLKNKAGTMFMVAAGSISAGNYVYAAAAGTVDAAGDIREGIALESAAAGDIFEVLPVGPTYDISETSLALADGGAAIFGTGSDAYLLWSTGDASDHSLVLGLGDTSQMLHITDKGARASDWAITSPTHPNVYIHSNTTPITDYLRIGDHDGTEADIDVVGGTSLALKIAGTEYASVRVTGLAVGSYVAAGTAGTDQVTIKSTGTAPASTGANVGHLFADFETDDDELFWLSGTGGTATQLTT